MKIPAGFLLILMLLNGCTNENKVEFKFEKRKFEKDIRFLNKITVDSICPGYTTITDLKNRGKQLAPVKVIDMNMGDIDSLNATLDGSSWGRNFLNFGFEVNHSGLIVLQAIDSTEIIKKIKLIKGYKGKVNNYPIEIGKTLVGDIEKAFPKFDWSTTEASDYFYYTNKDTISFYVRKNRSLKEFPFNEEYYRKQPVYTAEITIFFDPIYKQDYDNDITYEKPLYSPLSDNHINALATVRRHGIGTAVKEVTSLGKELNYDGFQLGRWKEYSPDHKLSFDAEFDNTGKLIKQYYPKP